MWIAWHVTFFAPLNAESAESGMVQMAARGLWSRLRKWQFFSVWASVCPAWVSLLSYLPLGLLQLSK